MPQSPPGTPKNDLQNSVPHSPLPPDAPSTAPAAAAAAAALAAVTSSPPAEGGAPAAAGGPAAVLPVADAAAAGDAPAGARVIPHHHGDGRVAGDQSMLACFQPVPMGRHGTHLGDQSTCSYSHLNWRDQEH